MATYSFNRLIMVKVERTSDGGNRSHNVSLPIILKKTKVGQILQYSCISLLLVPILLYWIQVRVGRSKPPPVLTSGFNRL